MRTFLGLFSIIIFALTSCNLANSKGAEGTNDQTKKVTPPNIIFIMTDDHTKQATSLYGSKLVNTPNIDRIGKEGIRFDKAFVTNSICAPSRAVMLTGKYSHMNGLRDNHDEFDTSQMTFPKLLQQAGYQTSLIGKWHLKNTPTGFDYWSILPGQGVYYNPTFLQMGDTVEINGYVTDIITDKALEVIKNRDASRPFCMLYHHKAPHRNWMPDLKHLELFKDTEFPLPETFFDDYKNRTNAASTQDMEVKNMYLSIDMKLQKEYYDKETGSGGGPPQHDAVNNWEGMYNRMTPEQKKVWDTYYLKVNEEYRKNKRVGKDLAKWKFQRYMQDYLKCVVSVDENVGRLLDYLDKNGLSENTIIVYTSDQGFYLGEHGWYDKRYMYEESFGTPLLIRYPKEIKAGTVSNSLVMNLDFASTFLDYAGVEVPKEIQGESLRKICRGNTPDDWRQSVYYHYYQSNGWHHVPKHYGVRTQTHKLIYFYELDQWEMFNLESDPNELMNLYEMPEQQQKVKELKGELNKLRKKYGDEGEG